MNNKTKLIVIIIACVVLFGLAILAYTLLSSNYGTQTVADKDDAKAHIENSTVSSNISDANSEQKSEYAAPDFQVTDKDGNIVKLSDFSGKPVVINFFTSWCQPCRNEMPYFEEMYRENDDVVFMMINVTYDDDKQAADALIKEEGYTFPVYYDTKGEASYIYNVQSYPMSFFVDKNGDLYTYYTGSITRESLHELINRIK